jgi:hypothetical protein
MLHERLADYLAEVESAVRALADGYVERYEEEILTPERASTCGCGFALPAAICWKSAKP